MQKMENSAQFCIENPRKLRLHCPNMADPKFTFTLTWRMIPPYNVATLAMGRAVSFKGSGVA